MIIKQFEKKSEALARELESVITQRRCIGTLQFVSAALIA